MPQHPTRLDTDLKSAITRLWTEAFAETVVITVLGNELVLQRLIESLPFDAGLLRIDTDRRGIDCRTGQPHSNHHVIVGERHKRIVQDARRRGLRNIFVLEDDAEFTPGDGATLVRVLEWTRDHDDGWDVFYMGFTAPLLSKCRRVTRDIVKPSRPLAAHALCYHRRVFDKILAIDFLQDHRSWVFRGVERLFSPGGRDNPYNRDGVGALDCWLSVSNLKRVAAHPIQVIQTNLSPDMARDWRRFSGSDYDVYETPRRLVRIALTFHYARWILLSIATLLLSFSVWW